MGDVIALAGVASMAVVVAGGQRVGLRTGFCWVLAGYGGYGTFVTAGIRAGLTKSD